MPLAPATLKLKNGRIVPMVHVSPTSPLTGLAAVLNIPPVLGSIAMVGGAAAFDKPEYDAIRAQVKILLHEIAQIALCHRLALVDGGTPFGVMRLMGEVCYAYGGKIRLVGVAPSGRVRWQSGKGGIDYAKTWMGGSLQQMLEHEQSLTPLDENHTAFVLVEANEWGDEVEMLAAVAHELAAHQATIEILINGGQVARRDVLTYLQKGGKVIVLEGSGRFADEVARAMRAGFSYDPDLKEVLNFSKNIHLFPLKEPPAVFTALLMGLGRWG